jgi:L-asparaginase
MVGVDDDASLFSQVDTLPLAGLVVASMAAGHVPAEAYRRILALAERGTTIVLCSSAVSGRTAEEYYYPHAYDDLRAAGVIIEDWLSPRKARIRLMLSRGLQLPYVPFGQEFVLLQG